MEWDVGGRGLTGRPLPWSMVEGILSGREVGTPRPVLHEAEPGRLSTPRPGPGSAEVPEGQPGKILFAELHATSSYNFLTGASDPEEMVQRARELGLSALALVDRDGFYGAVRFAEAAAEVGLDTVFGAELSLREGVLTVLCRGVEGYRRLSHLITDAAMATEEKGSVEYPPLLQVAKQGAGHWVVFAGVEWRDKIDHLIEYFGRDNVVLEFPARMLPEDTDHHDVLRAIQTRTGLRGILTTMPTAATRDRARLAGAKRALALRANLAAINPFFDVVAETVRVTSENLAALLAADDVVCEAFDRAEAKAMLVSGVLETFPEKPVVAASGMSGLASANAITTRRVAKRLYLCGDGMTDVDDNLGLYGARVLVCAAHQATMILRLIDGAEEP